MTGTNHQPPNSEFDALVPSDITIIDRTAAKITCLMATTQTRLSRCAYASVLNRIAMCSSS